MTPTQTIADFIVFLAEKGYDICPRRTVGDEEEWGSGIGDVARAELVREFVEGLPCV